MEDQSTKALEDKKECIRYNSMLVRGLLPLMPKQERVHAYKWLTKLSKTEGSSSQLKIKAEYLWFLVMNAQDREMLPPFRAPPPIGDLVPLSSMVPEEIYGYVMDYTNSKHWWLDEPLVEGLNDEDLQEEDQSCYFTPSEFAKKQPIPSSDGAYIYACIFAPRD